jgi:hypothetical protein
MSDNSEKRVLGNESDRDVDAETDNVTQQAPDRRRLFRRLMALAGLGITGVLLSQEKTGLLPPVHAPVSYIAKDAVNSGAGTTELDSTTSGAAFFGYASATTGSTTGVFGQSASYSGTGVHGFATASIGDAVGVYGRSLSPGGTGVEGFAYAPGGVALRGLAGNDGAIPLVAQANSSTQSAHLQEWQNYGGSALSVVDKNGHFGIGTTSPQFPLHLVGASITTGYIAEFQNTNDAARLVLNGVANLGGDLIFQQNGENQFGIYTHGGTGSGLGFYPYDGPPSTAAMYIQSNGNVGIGTTSPQSHLFVVDSTTDPSRGVVASQNNSGAQAALMQMTKSRGTQTSPTAVVNGDYVGAFNMNAFDGTSYLSGKPMAGWGAKVNGTVAAGSIPTDLFFYTKPSGTLDPYGDHVVRFIIASNGNIYANGSLLSASDMRLKTDIEPIPNALEKVLALNGVYFHWTKDAQQPDGRQVGVIAQNVQQVLPEIVSTSPSSKDYLSVDYTRLVPVLIEAVKELKTENNRLREQLTGNNQTLQERIAILERTVKQSTAS